MCFAYEVSRQLNSREVSDVCLLRNSETQTNTGVSEVLVNEGYFRFLMSCQ